MTRAAPGCKRIRRYDFRSGTGLARVFEPLSKTVTAPKRTKKAPCSRKGLLHAQLRKFLFGSSVFSSNAGFAILQVITPEAEILSIVIDPALRGRGHGRTLLGKALLAAATRGVERVFLEVESSNNAAVLLYESEGFARTGIRKNYYTSTDGTRSDALLMSRRIQAGT